jgi:hypothetical protein
MKRVFDVAHMYEFHNAYSLTTYAGLCEFFRRVDQSVYESKSIYYEMHHIIPRCEGGTDEANNFIRVPFIFHFRLHVLRARESSSRIAEYKNYVAANLIIGSLVKKRIKKTIEELYRFFPESIYRIKSEMIESLSSRLTAANPRARIVISLDTMRVYPTIRSAAQANGLHPNSIRACCTGEFKQARGTHWQYYVEGTDYADVLEELRSAPTKGFKLDNTHSCGRAVQRLDTGETFRSIKHAETVTGVPRNTIMNSIVGRTTFKLSPIPFAWAD